jgi:Phage protein Gp138 N-terminal domain
MSAPKTNWISLAQRLADEQSPWDILKWQLMCRMKVACPAIVVSFDHVKQTIVAQPVIRENMKIPTRDGNGNYVPVATPTTLPLLKDIPIVFPRAGGLSLTMPVTSGDECLLVFSDNCFNAWWTSGGIQNQERRRRHNLSDAFAILGPWSQPRKLVSYSTNSAQLRTDDGTVSISLNESGIAITYGAMTVSLNASNGIELSPDGGTSYIKLIAGEIDIQATIVKINGRSFLAHEHSGVSVGSGNTGGVL